MKKSNATALVSVLLLAAAPLSSFGEGPAGAVNPFVVNPSGIETVIAELARSEAATDCERDGASPRECFKQRRLGTVIERAKQREQRAKLDAYCVAGAAQRGCQRLRSILDARLVTVPDCERLRAADREAAETSPVTAFCGFVERRLGYLRDYERKVACEAGNALACGVIEAQEKRERERLEKERRERDARVRATVRVPPAVVAAPKGRPVDACPGGAEGWVRLGSHDACAAGQPCVCRYDPNVSRDAARPFCPGGKWERLGTKQACESGADCRCSADLNVSR